nr:5645_t:CDS:2 [Entrophospora candida]
MSARERFPDEITKCMTKHRLGKPVLKEFIITSEKRTTWGLEVSAIEDIYCHALQS